MKLQSPDQTRQRSEASESRRRRRPLGSYLLRVFEERVELVRHRYELQDLASGEVQRFESLPALQRHLRSRGDETASASIVAMPEGVAKPRR